MKTIEEIKARYWFLKGNSAGLKYASSFGDRTFEEEIKETQHHIMVLKWILEDNKVENTNNL